MLSLPARAHLPLYCMEANFSRWQGEGLDEVGIDTATGKVRVKVNPAFYRQLDVENLSGSAAKAKNVLGWEHTYNFKTLVREMVLSDLEKAKAGRLFATSYLDWLVKDGADVKVPGQHSPALTADSSISSDDEAAADRDMPPHTVSPHTASFDVLARKAEELEKLQGVKQANAVSA